MKDMKAFFELKELGERTRHVATAATGDLWGRKNPGMDIDQLTGVERPSHS